MRGASLSQAWHSVTGHGKENRWSADSTPLISRVKTSPRPSVDTTRMGDSNVLALRLPRDFSGVNSTKSPSGENINPYRVYTRVIWSHRWMTVMYSLCAYRGISPEYNATKNPSGENNFINPCVYACNMVTYALSWCPR